MTKLCARNWARDTVVTSAVVCVIFDNVIFCFSFVTAQKLEPRVFFSLGVFFVSTDRLAQIKTAKTTRRLNTCHIQEKSQHLQTYATVLFCDDAACGCKLPTAPNSCPENVDWWARWSNHIG